MGQNIEQLIRVYANCEDLIPSKLDGKQMESAKDLLIHFRRGFNTRQPLSVFEDTSISGPSGAGGKSVPLFSSLNPRSTADLSII